MKRIGISVKPNDERAASLAGDLCEWLGARGCEVLLDADATACPGAPLAPLDDIARRVELMIVLGGDGTLLHVARRFIGSEVPILGINLGRLGFLTDTPVGGMFEVVGEVLAGHLKTKRHFSLRAASWRGDARLGQGWAINDVVLQRGDHPRMIAFEMDVRGQFVFRMRGDGLVLATPAGSTAYAL
ncbi:MAG: NAD(+)/NADH kinase, partial [Mariprofundaceae bacterium]